MKTLPFLKVQIYLLIKGLLALILQLEEKLCSVFLSVSSSPPAPGPPLLPSILINKAGCSPVAGTVLSHSRSRGLCPCPARWMSRSSVIPPFFKRGVLLVSMKRGPPSPVAEVFLKDLNMWVSVCSSLEVTPLRDVQLYGMNPLKRPTQLPWLEGGNQNPHDSFSSGSWCCGQLFCSVGFLFFLLLMRNSHITHTYAYTHVPKLMVLWLSSCVPCRFVEQHVFSACTSTFAWSASSLWEYLAGLLPDLCSSLSVRASAHPSIHPSMYPPVSSNMRVCCAAVMSCFRRRE